MKQIPEPAQGSVTVSETDAGDRIRDRSEGADSSEYKEILVLKPEIQTGRSDYYAGSEKCFRCHESIFKSWQSTPHGQMFDSRIESVPHQGNCKRCHWTGDQEQRIGCEACHGFMGSHTLHPELVLHPECRLCEMMKKCIQCHTRAISSDFDTSSAWRRIDHGS